MSAGQVRCRTDTGSERSAQIQICNKGLTCGQQLFLTGFLLHLGFAQGRGWLAIDTAPAKIEIHRLGAEREEADQGLHKPSTRKKCIGETLSGSNQKSTSRSVKKNAKKVRQPDLPGKRMI